MRQYELIVVFVATVDDKDTKKLEEAVKKLVGDEGTVSQVTVMGKKYLAYPIRKQEEGVYVLATVASDRLRVSEIEKRAKMGSEVLRYLLTAK